MTSTANTEIDPEDGGAENTEYEKDPITAEKIEQAKRDLENFKSSTAVLISKHAMVLDLVRDREEARAASVENLAQKGVNPREAEQVLNEKGEDLMAVMKRLGSTISNFDKQISDILSKGRG